MDRETAVTLWHKAGRDVELFASMIEAAERDRWEPALRALMAVKWCTPEYEQVCRAAAALLKA